MAIYVNGVKAVNVEHANGDTYITMESMIVSPLLGALIQDAEKKFGLPRSGNLRMRMISVLSSMFLHLATLEGTNPTGSAPPKETGPGCR